MATDALSLTPPVTQRRIQAQPNFADPTTGAAQPTVPDALVRAIIAQESTGHTNAVGKKGEMGLMQITPAVAQRYNVPLGQLMDPETNKRVGTQYLQDLMKEFGGNLPMVLAAYNAGPSRVKGGMIPESTRRYVRDVLGKIGGSMENAIMGGEAYGAENGDAWSHAKPISDPWAGARPVADPWKGAAPTAKATPNPIEAGYEKYIRDPGRKALVYDPSGLTQKYFLGVGRDVAKMVLPDTATGAAVNTALMGTGLGEMGLAARLAIPTLAGAAAGQATGSGAGMGALEGLASSAGGELVGAGLGTAGRLAGKAGLLRNTTAKVGGKIGDELANAGSKIFPSVPKPQTAADMERLFTLGDIEGEIALATKPVRDHVANLTRGVRFQVPVMKGSGKVTIQDMSLPEAERALKTLGDLGYAKGGLKTTIAAPEARRLAFNTRGQIAQKINRLHPGMGDQWLAARRQTGAAKSLQRLFNESNGVINMETGQIDQPALVRAIIKDFDDLRRNLGDSGAHAILQAARRGSLEPVVDFLSHKPHIGIRAGLGHIAPHLSPGNTYRPVGDVPGIFRNQTYRAPAAVAIRSWLDRMGDSYAP